MDFDFFGRTFSFFSRPGQWDKFVGMLKDYLLKPAVIAAFVLILAWICLYVYARKARKSVLSDRLRRLSPLIYLVLILSLTIFNREFGGAPGEFHLLPDFVFEAEHKFHETRILLAIVDFLYYIPYGALIKWSNPRFKTYQAILIVVATGFAAEFLQFLLATGVGTVEQWLMDSLGGILGIVLMKFIQKRKLEKKP